VPLSNHRTGSLAYSTNQLPASKLDEGHFNPPAFTRNALSNEYVASVFDHRMQHRGERIWPMGRSSDSWQQNSVNKDRPSDVPVSCVNVVKVAPVLSAETIGDFKRYLDPSTACEQMSPQFHQIIGGHHVNHAVPILLRGWPADGSSLGSVSNPVCRAAGSLVGGCGQNRLLSLPMTQQQSAKPLSDPSRIMGPFVAAYHSNCREKVSERMVSHSANPHVYGHANLTGTSLTDHMSSSKVFMNGMKTVIAPGFYPKQALSVPDNTYQVPRCTPTAEPNMKQSTNMVDWKPSYADYSSSGVTFQSNPYSYGNPACSRPLDSIIVQRMSFEDVSCKTEETKFPLKNSLVIPSGNPPIHESQSAKWDNLITKEEVVDEEEVETTLHEKSKEEDNLVNRLKNNLLEEVPKCGCLGMSAFVIVLIFSVGHI
jgi:hypothetical protein